jgi:hypothetical protein
MLNLRTIQQETEAIVPNCGYIWSVLGTVKCNSLNMEYNFIIFTNNIILYEFLLSLVGPKNVVFSLKTDDFVTFW